MPRMQPSEYNILLHLYFCYSLRCIYCSRSSIIAFYVLCPFYRMLVAIGHSNIYALLYKGLLLYLAKPSTPIAYLPFSYNNHLSLVNSIISIMPLAL